MTVYAFGDSHTMCARHANGVAAAYAGPVTMHRLGRAGEPTKLFGLNRLGDTIQGIFVLAGEIDVRSHVATQILRGREPEEILDALANGAARCVQELQAAFDTVVYFCSVIPPSLSQEHNPEFPFRGDLEDRVKWTFELNRALEAVVDHLYDPYVNFRSDGILPEEYSDGSVHLHNRYGQRAFGPLVGRITG